MGPVYFRCFPFVMFPNIISLHDCNSFLWVSIIYSHSSTSFVISSLSYTSSESISHTQYSLLNLNLCSLQTIAEELFLPGTSILSLFWQHECCSYLAAEGNHFPSLLCNVGLCFLKVLCSLSYSGIISATQATSFHWEIPHPKPLLLLQFVSYWE